MPNNYIMAIGCRFSSCLAYEVERGGGNGGGTRDTGRCVYFSRHSDAGRGLRHLRHEWTEFAPRATGRDVEAADVYTRRVVDVGLQGAAERGLGSWPLSRSVQTLAEWLTWACKICQGHRAAERGLGSWPLSRSVQTIFRCRGMAFTSPAKALLWRAASAMPQLKEPLFAAWQPFRTTPTLNSRRCS